VLSPKQPSPMLHLLHSQPLNLLVAWSWSKDKRNPLRLSGCKQHSHIVGRGYGAEGMPLRLWSPDRMLSLTFTGSLRR
jgi:predicted MPP superfamily phosphohydrolase